MTQKAMFENAQQVIDLCAKYGIKVERIGLFGDLLIASVAGNVRHNAQQMRAAGVTGVRVETGRDGQQVIEFSNPLLFTIDIEAYEAWYRENVSINGSKFTAEDRVYITESAEEDRVYIRSEVGMTVCLPKRFLIPITD